MPPFPPIEPYDHGMLAVGDGHNVYWEVCGNPEVKPAVVLHGGPGSGCSPRWRRLFDPGAYRVVLFDQRGCGRSTPHAGEPDVDMSANNTQALVADIELLRGHLGIERWLVLGGSWGSTLALAYAEAHPGSVSEMVLFGVTTGRHSEFEWASQGISAFFPQQWQRLVDALPASMRDGDVVAAYNELLFDADPEVCRTAAEAWCLWESATPAWPPTEGMAERFKEPRYALAFARIVTHYFRNRAWLEDGVLLREAGRLGDIPAVLINGRFDFQAPLANAWELRRAWPSAELVVVDNAGHAMDNEGITEAIVAAVQRFATDVG